MNNHIWKSNKHKYISLIENFRQLKSKKKRANHKKLLIFVMKFIKNENKNDKKMLYDENYIEELLYKAIVTGSGTLPSIRTHIILM